MRTIHDKFYGKTFISVRDSTGATQKVFLLTVQELKLGKDNVTNLLNAIDL